jgi:hypothetical protein
MKYTLIILLLVSTLHATSLFDAQQTPAQKIAVSLDAHANKTLDRMVWSYNQAMRDFWNNEEATPQEISDVWGTGAAARFIANGRLRAAINSIAPGASAEGDALQGTFTINADGTVTITTPDPQARTWQPPSLLYALDNGVEIHDLVYRH